MRPRLQRWEGEFRVKQSKPPRKPRPDAGRDSGPTEGQLYLLMDSKRVVRVPWVGDTWQQRRWRYWLRRVGAALVYLLLTLIVGFMAAGFTYAIAGHPTPSTPGLIAAACYALTSLWGVRLGVKILKKFPVDISRDMNGFNSKFPNPFYVLMFAPMALGLSLTVLIAFLGWQAPGEARAREFTERHRIRPS
jgi:hypothetical protein